MNSNTPIFECTCLECGYGFFSKSEVDYCSLCINDITISFKKKLLSIYEERNNQENLQREISEIPGMIKNNKKLENLQDGDDSNF